jgi:hypothetical protein
MGRNNLITHCGNMVYPFYVGEIDWKTKHNSPGQEILTAVKNKRQSHAESLGNSNRERNNLNFVAILQQGTLICAAERRW